MHVDREKRKRCQPPFSHLFVQFDPTQEKEIRKKRPCLLVSPDELNEHLSNAGFHQWRGQRALVSLFDFSFPP